MNTFISHSPEETEELAARIAGETPPGSVILLTGGLGAGKTAFTRGFARAKGITEPVSSPTFTIIQEYPLPGGGMLYHMDLYRIDGPDAALAFGIDEFLNDPKAICLVEWHERGTGLYPEGHTREIVIDQDRKNPLLRTISF